MAPRSSLVSISRTIFATIFNDFLKENQILRNASGYGDLLGPGALKQRLQIIKSTPAITNYRKDEKAIGRLRKFKKT